MRSGLSGATLEFQMVACQQCGTNSPLDSKFCKHCGVALSEDARKEAQERVKQMLEEGNLLFTEGRTDEALMVAEAAAKADPSNALALSLKGLCLERTGQLALALEAYEEASLLNPTGTLDRIKVQSLRQRLTQAAVSAESSQAPDQRRALMLAGAALVFVAAAGSLLAVTLGGHPASVAKNDSSAQSQFKGQIQGFDSTSQTSPNSTPSTGTSPNNPNNGTGIQNPQQGPTSTGGTLNDQNDSQVRLPKAPGGILPDPATGPIVINRDPVESNEKVNQPSSSGDLDPTPRPEGQGSERNPNAGRGQTSDPNPGPSPRPTTTPQDDPGYIDIQVTPHSGGRPNQPGAQSIQSIGTGLGANGIEALRRSAQNQFEIGHYQQAAAAYDKLARQGGNSAKVQQRLGQCYENIGNTAAAARAFNNAILLYQADIKANRDPAASQLGLNACQQALKVVNGG